MRIAKRLLSTTALALALSPALAPDATACPNCKEAVAEQPDEAGRLREGYSYSILVMLGMPFLLLGTGAFFLARAVRRGALPPL
jgi:hypothetical protein